MLTGKHIVIGVTGGIAAYKVPELVRLFIKAGAEVKIVMTKDAAQFVTAQTLSVLSKNEVKIGFFDSAANWNNHVHLAEWADLMIVAPATANTLAKMATGLCDNLLMAVYQSASCPVFIAPAMDLEMYRKQTTKENLQKLGAHKVHIVPPGTGELASGLSGEGRMAEPLEILEFVEKTISESLPLHGKKILINAGPTYEAIDPVRFIGNRSSGKMGIAIADEAIRRGAIVTLVLGPTHLVPESKGINLIKVESALDMHNACLEHFSGQDIIILSAAVADYKPVTESKEKIKKADGSLSLELTGTRDILKELGAMKKQSQLIVGFALETKNLEDYAKEKLRSKNLDLIIANEATNSSGSVFGSDQNKITAIDKSNKITKFELMSKKEIAKEILNLITEQIS